jgi:hypothetical protein
VLWPANLGMSRASEAASTNRWLVPPACLQELLSLCQSIPQLVSPFMARRTASSQPQYSAELPSQRQQFWPDGDALCPLQPGAARAPGGDVSVAPAGLVLPQAVDWLRALDQELADRLQPYRPHLPSVSQRTQENASAHHCNGNDSGSSGDATSSGRDDGGLSPCQVVAAMRSLASLAHRPSPRLLAALERHIMHSVTHQGTLWPVPVRGLSLQCASFPKGGHGEP